MKSLIIMGNGNTYVVDESPDEFYENYLSGTVENFDYLDLDDFTTIAITHISEIVSIEE
ncbi:hypothetical protein JFL43_03180 [Viridibacillus sp. YIM B01967]|jgi:hypothetical protein|uniref:Phage protein n=1 Tax=Viridibacillus soli TaxID=2798301 RepID=A0ABS1H3J1_9BACL|nr:hypothetical protein [Viridibacillus soli]MBK3493874.1 hypothetical protein [Viridibacillus soli]